MNEGLCLKAKPGHLKPPRRLKQSDQLRCRAHLGFFLLCVPLAGKGVSQAAEEDSSGIRIHRLSVR